ncbi:MAG: TIGR04283 family arsenosugar biosynthesis glycosyltransferase [Desulfuromonadales bacterium]|nr:TIGR04283 family arsenosugar biosynthesis glycosyltransferase [Desulfuromonadales bacterium]
MPTGQKPQLSIIVPVLNEADELPLLFENLGNQCAIGIELILCDGGSSDETQLLAEQLSKTGLFPVQYIRTKRGRGCQMNAGAARARSDILLFLHADSRFFQRDALERAVPAFRDAMTKTAGLVAGRFGLRFRRQTSSPSLAYAFYEAKARLNRADCIRGDQGFMLSRAFFNQMGQFDDSLPYLEDVRLALAIAGQASWILLPAEIFTSARRFETEGLYERQVANAIIANALICGWTELLTSLPDFYRCRAESGRLELHPLLNGTRRLIGCNPLQWQLSFWHATGRHVAANIWQLFFWMDVRRSFRAGRSRETIPKRWAYLFDRCLEPLSRTTAMAVMTAAVVWLWFQLLLITNRRKCG